MRGLYFDGRTSRPHPVEVTLDGERLIIGGAGATLTWALARLRLIEQSAAEVRLGEPHGGDGRLVLALDDWRAIMASSGVAPRTTAHATGAKRLVAILAIVGLSVAALVFVGIPLAAGPLARATPPDLEWRLGQSLEAQALIAMPPCDALPAAAARLETLGQRVSEAADTPFLIQVQAVHAPMANAFALPGGRILVTDRLIALTQTPDELAAVLAHETAHVEKRHVMQSVWRSMAAGLLLDAVLGGGSGAGQQAVLLVSQLQTQKFSRSLEAEADTRGVELLRAGGYSTLGMASFFDKIRDPGQAGQELEWLSSHPDTAGRAALARTRGRPGRPIMTPQDWALLKTVCETPTRSSGK